jgi:hypothetical protein
MDIYIIKGKIYKIMDLDIVTENFQKQEFVIQVVAPGEKATYSEFIKFQCINQKVTLLEGLEKGDFCIIKFKITGRKYKRDGKDDLFFTNLDVQELSMVHAAKDQAKEIRPVSDINDYSDIVPGIDKIVKPKEEDFGTSCEDLPF